MRPLTVRRPRDTVIDLDGPDFDADVPFSGTFARGAFECFESDGDDDLSGVEFFDVAPPPLRAPTDPCIAFQRAFAAELARTPLPGGAREPRARRTARPPPLPPSAPPTARPTSAPISDAEIAALRPSRGRALFAGLALVAALGAAACALADGASAERVARVATHARELARAALAP